ncbi:MAG: hypothetical protein C0595_13540 [Marinilabiliales bacterium]|nr:MAG: hypothetical protein C0595_13540 [Marinilabiliales bacterium]
MKFFGPKKTISSRGPSYYDRENLVHTMKDLISIYFPKGKTVQNTDETIMFNDLKLSEINEKKLSGVFGVADYVISGPENINDYRVYFYRHSIGKFNYLMQFHFCKKNFLFVNNMVRSSYVLSSEEKKIILLRFKEKYYADLDFDHSKGFDLQIVDQNNNFFYTIDDVNFSISYINNSNYFKEIIDNFKSSKNPIDNNQFLL